MTRSEKPTRASISHCLLAPLPSCLQINERSSLLERERRGNEGGDQPWGSRKGGCSASPRRTFDLQSCTRPPPPIGQCSRPLCPCRISSVSCLLLLCSSLPNLILTGVLCPLPSPTLRRRRAQCKRIRSSKEKNDIVPRCSRGTGLHLRTTSERRSDQESFAPHRTSSLSSLDRYVSGQQPHLVTIALAVSKSEMWERGDYGCKGGARA